jgi:hypothetical protein
VLDFSATFQNLDLLSSSFMKLRQILRKIQRGFLLNIPFCPRFQMISRDCYQFFFREIFIFSVFQFFYVHKIPFVPNTYTIMLME